MLGIYISEERNMFVGKRFIKSLVEKYGQHQVILIMVHRVLNHIVLILKHYVHPPFEKSLIERSTNTSTQ